MAEKDLDELMRKLTERRADCLITFLNPFRLVETDQSSQWQPQLSDINSASWDYVELHRIVGAIDVGLPHPFNMVVARDGALALPIAQQLNTNQSAVEFYNRCLASFLLGGVYCEAIGPDALDLGFILDWKYLRVNTGSSAAPNRFHNSIRGQHQFVEAIALMHPANLKLAALQEAFAVGKMLLETVPELSPDFLLKGVTAIARRAYSEALANLWIVIEQLTSHLWEKHIVSLARESDEVAGRISQLNDTRTYSAAVRQELLFQRGIIPSTIYSALFSARRARNQLSHEGLNPGKEAAWSTYKGACGLLSASARDAPLPLLKLNLEDHSITDWLAKTDTRLEPKYWQEIKKLPGETEIEELMTQIRRSRLQRS